MNGFSNFRFGLTPDPFPPLPDPIPIPDPFPGPIPRPDPLPLPFPPPRYPFPTRPSWPTFNFRSLREGCYLIRFTPTAAGFSFYHYDGTLRVERAGTNTIASGDLYYHSLFSWWGTSATQEPSPSGGIPIFRRSKYRYYLRVTQILEWLTLGNSFTLGFERHRLDQSTNVWTNQGAFTAGMEWTTAPPDYPDSSNYLKGDVKNSGGQVIGNLTMGWVSPYLRRATVEIDRVSQSELPGNNGSGIDWPAVYDAVGWDVTVDSSNADVNEPSGQGWSDAELHAAMLSRRDSADLDNEWRYHLLCVRQLDSTSRGIMYDAYGGDSNNIPREGAGISSHWVIPNGPPWGNVQGQRFGTAAAPYFRTAIHEIGHAMGLYHNSTDNGFMNTTGTIANSSGTFPNNIQWSFNTADAKRLRHMPDPWVRPGMIPFGQSYSTTPISPDDDAIVDAEGLDLQVSAMLPSVPIGAPIRVDLRLANNAGQPLPVPDSLGLKSGHVTGFVVDPAGTRRAFRSIVRCIDEDDIGTLQPNKQISDSLTLLRGPQGALFPAPGVHQIVVDVVWEAGGVTLGVSGNAHVMVTPPVDDDHSQAALTVLSAPDALLSLAIGGDHLKDGNAAIDACLKNPVLRPHYAIVEAKRLGRRYRKRSADVSAACQLIDKDSVLSASEIKRVGEVIQQSKKDSRRKGAISQTIKTLQRKAQQIGTDSDVVKMLDSL